MSEVLTKPETPDFAKSSDELHDALDSKIQKEAKPSFFRLKAQLPSQGRTNVPMASSEKMWVTLKTYAHDGENELHAHPNEDHTFVVLQGQASFRGPNGEEKIIGKNEGVLLPHNTFYWFNSSTLTGGAKTWGVAAVGDIPLIADIDGDHRADLAVWRPGNGTFYWVLSSRGYSSSAAGSVQWGVAAAGDTPSLADMDGDGKADPVVWRPSTSEWFWLKSSVGYSPSRAGYVNMAPR